VERVAAATEASRAVVLASKGAGRGGAVLIVEDDPAVRDSLEMLLQAEGYSIASAANGEEALAIAARHDFAPNIAIVDYNLPGGHSGVEVATRLRQALGGELAVMVLTGDISSATLEQVARHGFLHCNKPLRGDDLLVLIATVRAKQQR
jgi:two-component system CheB/CheR fusion protein